MTRGPGNRRAWRTAALATSGAGDRRPGDRRRWRPAGLVIGGPGDRRPWRPASCRPAVLSTGLVTGGPGDRRPGDRRHGERLPWRPAFPATGRVPAASGGDRPARSAAALTDRRAWRPADWPWRSAVAMTGGLASWQPGDRRPWRTAVLATCWPWQPAAAVTGGLGPGMPAPATGGPGARRSGRRPCLGACDVPTRIDEGRRPTSLNAWRPWSGPIVPSWRSTGSRCPSSSSCSAACGPDWSAGAAPRASHAGSSSPELRGYSMTTRGQMSRTDHARRGRPANWNCENSRRHRGGDQPSCEPSRQGGRKVLAPRKPYLVDVTTPTVGRSSCHIRSWWCLNETPM